MSDSTSLNTQDLYDRITAIRLELGDYNFVESKNVKEIFKILIVHDKLTRLQALDSIKTFYEFNAYNITSSQIQTVLEPFMNAPNYPQQIQPPQPPQQTSGQRYRSSYPSLFSFIQPGLRMRPPPVQLNPTIFDFRNVLNIMNPLGPVVQDSTINEQDTNDNSLDSLSDTESIEEEVQIPIPQMTFEDALQTVQNSLSTQLLDNPLLTGGIFNNLRANNMFNPQQNMNRIFLNGISRLLQPPPPMEDVQLVLKKNVYDKLEKTLYKDLSDEEKKENPTCPLSLDEYKDDDLMVRLPCKHLFAEQSIKSWLLDDNHTCPVCRKSAGEYKPKI